MPLSPIPDEAAAELEAAVARAAGGPVREATRVRQPATRYYLSGEGRAFWGGVGGRPRVRERRLRGYGLTLAPLDAEPGRERVSEHHDVRDLYAEAWGRPHPDAASLRAMRALRLALEGEPPQAGKPSPGTPGAPP